MSIIRDREPTAQRTDRILNEILAESPRESPFDDPSYPIGFEKIITMEGAQQFLLRQLRRFLYFLRGLQTDSTEIESKVIGNFVAKRLKKIDKIAYIRFASVFRRFVDVEDFEKELQKLL